MDTASEVWKLQQHVSQLRDQSGYTDTAHIKAALYKIADTRDSLTEVATALVEDAIHAGMSQAEIARCMDVPASYLRGAKREFAV